LCYRIILYLGRISLVELVIMRQIALCKVFVDRWEVVFDLRCRRSLGWRFCVLRWRWKGSIVFFTNPEQCESELSVRRYTGQ
jgi:hypothetical protein